MNSLRVFRRRKLKHYLMLLPFFALFAVFFLYPIIYGVAISLSKWDGVHPATFVGVKNYLDVINHPKFGLAMGNLLKFMVIVVPVGILIALGLALLVDRFTSRWASVFRAIYFFPIVISLVLSSVIWRFLLSPEPVGLVNTVLAKVGITGISWLNDPNYEIAAVAIVDMWHAIGFHFLLLFAGLKAIPIEYYEAAMVDGATGFQRIRHISIPLLEPVLFLVAVNAVIGGLQSFEVPWLLSNSQPNNYGGVGGGMLFPVMDIYVRAWQGLAFGNAAAYAMILLVLTLFVTGVQFAWRRWRLNYY